MGAHGCADSKAAAMNAVVIIYEVNAEKHERAKKGFTNRFNMRYYVPR